MKVLVILLILYTKYIFKCIKPYPLSNFSVCEEFCSVCDGPTECLDCVEGYMLDNGVCHMCPEFCSLCTLDGNCTDCVAGYYLEQNQCHGKYILYSW